MKDVIQFDEPAFNVYFEEVRDWGVAALERARQGVASCKDQRAHLLRLRHRKPTSCGRSLSATNGGNTKQTFPLLAKSTIDRVSLECANSRSRSSSSLCVAGKDVLVGAIDVATTSRERPKRWQR